MGNNLKDILEDFHNSSIMVFISLELEYNKAMSKLGSKY